MSAVDEYGAIYFGASDPAVIRGIVPEAGAGEDSTPDGDGGTGKPGVRVLEWCEQCKSKHTKEFGDAFHGLMIAQPVYDTTALQHRDWLQLEGMYFDDMAPLPAGTTTVRVSQYEALPAYIELTTRIVPPVVPRRRWWQFWRAG